MAYVSKVNIDGTSYDILASYVGASDLSTSSGQLLSVSSGKLSKSTATIGSGTNPVYLSSGVITKSGSTVGSGTNPVYLSSGTITKSSSTVGSGTNPVYLSSGTITKSSSTVGSTSTPVYLNSGTLAEATNVKPKRNVLYEGSLAVGKSTTISDIGNYIAFGVQVTGLGITLFGLNSSISSTTAFEIHATAAYVTGSSGEGGQVHVCVDLNVSGTTVRVDNITMIIFQGPSSGGESYSVYASRTSTYSVTNIIGLF